MNVSLATVAELLRIAAHSILPHMTARSPEPHPCLRPLNPNPCITAHTPEPRTPFTKAPRPNLFACSFVYYGAPIVLWWTSPYYYYAAQSVCDSEEDGAALNPNPTLRASPEPLAPRLRSHPKEPGCLLKSSAPHVLGGETGIAQPKIRSTQKSI